MVKFNNVSFSYGEKSVLNNFSLSISKGGRVCLFGESGCGKTTVLRLLLGLEKPQSGTVEKKDGIKYAVVFQENRLLPFKTVAENVSLFAKSEADVMYHLNALGLADSAEMYPDELSGGMQRRTALARALCTDYDILVLDEAFTGLDSGNIISAAEHILKSASDRPIVLVTHNEDITRLFGADIINM